MIKSAMYAITFALVSALSLPVLAQDAPAKNTVATVQVDGGVIMVSEGGPFTTAVTGQKVIAGTRLMVSKDSAASVVYDDGCKQSYTKAGVYEIDANCKAAAVLTDNGGMHTVGVVLGAVGTAAVAYGVYCYENNNCSGSSPSR